VILSGREGRHALRVLRLRPGDPVTHFDGTGTEYDAVMVARRGSAGAELRIEGRRAVDREPTVAVTLAVGIPREKRMAQLVRGCCELGAERIVPMVTERTEMRGTGPADQAGERWRRIAVEASKQSGRNRVTRVDDPTPLDAVVAEIARHPVSLLASTEAAAPPLARVLGGREPSATALALVGPEGDFTHAESDAIRSAGGADFRLGRPILRVETAAVAVLAAIRAVWPDPPVDSA
jgi:16S rRNA (uracil1498-N3)-methyltransferase